MRVTIGNVFSGEPITPTFEGSPPRIGESVIVYVERGDEFEMERWRILEVAYLIRKGDPLYGGVSVAAERIPDSEIPEQPLLDDPLDSFLK
jgi:hypothetical protein